MKNPGTSRIKTQDGVQPTGRFSNLRGRVSAAYTLPASSYWFQFSNKTEHADYFHSPLSGPKEKRFSRNSPLTLEKRRA